VLYEAARGSNERHVGGRHGRCGPQCANHGSPCVCIHARGPADGWPLFRPSSEGYARLVGRLELVEQPVSSHHIVGAVDIGNPALVQLDGAVKLQGRTDPVRNGDDGLVHEHVAP
jgi:hypothetical protein